MAKKRTDLDDVVTMMFDDNKQSQPLNQESFLGRMEKTTIEELREKGLIVSEIEPSKLTITPLNKRFDKYLNTNFKSFNRLVESIRKNGQIQAAIGRLMGDGHVEVLAGKNRFEACKLIGIPLSIVVLRGVDDLQAMRFLFAENEDRTELSQIEKSIQLLAFKEAGATNDELRSILNVNSDAAISKRIAFAKIDSDLLNLFDDPRILPLEDGYLLSKAFNDFIFAHENERAAVLTSLNELYDPSQKIGTSIGRMIKFLSQSHEQKPSVSKRYTKREKIVDDTGREWSLSIGRSGEIRIKTDSDNEDAFSQLIKMIQGLK